MDQLTVLVSKANSFIWGLYCLIPLLCGTGLYFTLRLNFVQIRKFAMAFKYTFGQLTLFGKRADKDGMSSFQALATAIAAQVGTGNLAGAATAIAVAAPARFPVPTCAAIAVARAWKELIPSLSARLPKRVSCPKVYLNAMANLRIWTKFSLSVK